MKKQNKKGQYLVPQTKIGNAIVLSVLCGSSEEDENNDAKINPMKFAQAINGTNW